MSDPLKPFYDHARQIFDLAQAQQALEWDQQVMMPPGGLDQRARQLATLAAVVHGRVSDPAYGALIAGLEARPDLPETVRADALEARRAFERAVKIPGRLVQARAEACSLAQAAWEAARPRGDFAAFRPHLERVVALTREQADAVGGGYDALLDDYEPGTSPLRRNRPLLLLRNRPGTNPERTLDASSQPPWGGERGRFSVGILSLGIRADHLDVASNSSTLHAARRLTAQTWSPRTLAMARCIVLRA